MSVAPGRPGDSRRLSVARAHGPPKQQRAASHLTMSNRVIPFFVFGAGLLRFSNLGSFPQKWPRADARSRHAHSLTSCRRDSSNSVPPMRGDGAPTGALILSVAPATRDPLSRGDRDLSRRSTVAVFGCGPTKPAPGSGTGACSDCPRQAVKPGGRGPDLPALRFAPQRGTPLLAPSCRIVSRKRPSEPRMQIVYYKFVT